MKQEQTKLPAHLQKIVDEIEAKEKAFGIINMAQILNNIKNPCDFHPVHAMCRGN